MSSIFGLKAICQRILTKSKQASGLSRHDRGQKDQRIHTKLIDIEDITTLDHVVDKVLFKVKNRRSRKSRTCLMISDTQVTLYKKGLNIFAIGLDQVVGCFWLPFEPRAIALVFRKGTNDGYCCVCLVLNNALTSLSGWQVWDTLCYKQTSFMIRNMNRKFTEEVERIHGANFAPSSSPTCSLNNVSDTSIGLSPSSFTTGTPISSTSFFEPTDRLSPSKFGMASNTSALVPPATESPQIQQATISTSSISLTSVGFTLDSELHSKVDSCESDYCPEIFAVLQPVTKANMESGASEIDSGTGLSLSNSPLSTSDITTDSVINDTSFTTTMDTAISTDQYEEQNSTTDVSVSHVQPSDNVAMGIGVTKLEECASSRSLLDGDDDLKSTLSQTLIRNMQEETGDSDDTSFVMDTDDSKELQSLLMVPNGTETDMESGASETDSGTGLSLSNSLLSTSDIKADSVINDTSCTTALDTGISTDHYKEQNSTTEVLVSYTLTSENVAVGTSVANLEEYASSRSLPDSNPTLSQTLITDILEAAGDSDDISPVRETDNSKELQSLLVVPNGTENDLKMDDFEWEILSHSAIGSKSEPALSISNTDLSSDDYTQSEHQDGCETCSCICDSCSCSNYCEAINSNVDESSSNSNSHENCQSLDIDDTTSRVVHSCSNTSTNSNSANTINLSSCEASSCTAAVSFSKTDSNGDGDSLSLSDSCSQHCSENSPLSPDNTYDNRENSCHGCTRTIPHSSSDLSLCSCKHCRLCYGSECDSCSGCSCECTCSCTLSDCDTCSCSCYDSDISEDEFDYDYDGDDEELQD